MRIIVIGAGKVGYTLADRLTSEEHDVTVIDKSDDVIERCSGSLDVICLKGNGANAKVLLEAGVDKANIVIASTESDETNMLACLIAKRLGAQYTIARIRDPEFNESQMLLQNELGIDVAIKVPPGDPASAARWKRRSAGSRRSRGIPPRPACWRSTRRRRPR